MKNFIMLLIFMVLLIFPLNFGLAQEDDDDLDDAYKHIRAVCQNDRFCINFYYKLDTGLKILEEIAKQYIEQVDKDELAAVFMKEGLKGVFGKLDPHSKYYESETNLVSAEEGKVGIMFSMENGKAIIAEVLEGGPAEQAGIMDGDIMLEIDGKPLSNLTLAQVGNLLVGKIGSEVSLKVLREGKEFTFSVKRAKVVLENLIMKNGDGILYVKLREFSDGNAEKIYSFLKEQKSAKGIILDLRNNPGGLVDEMAKIASLFLGDDDLIETLVMKKETEKHYAKNYRLNGTTRITLPVVVLVNANSASASEIFAAAMQDHSRAVIIGEPTFGKAITQISTEGSIFWLFRLGGDYFTITIGRNYRPNGKSLQGKGVIPDLIISKRDGEDLKKMMEMWERERQYEKNLSRHLKGEDESSWTKEEEEKLAMLKRDRQLDFAIEVLEAIYRATIK